MVILHKRDTFRGNMRLSGGVRVFIFPRINPKTTVPKIWYSNPGQELGSREAVRAMQGLQFVLYRLLIATFSMRQSMGLSIFHVMLWSDSAPTKLLTDKKRKSA